ncbi:hypothetical protein HMPREF9554_02603 [Treponema phagedenis F0421]|nr:hypothetical protein [Treponema phagedenis]EFW36903.1 hypothetical protein HMPREF9554_02603 [Treponema phagedenis F0421]
MAEQGLNVYKFDLARDKRGGTAIMSLQVDGINLNHTLQSTIEQIENVQKVILIQPY